MSGLLARRIGGPESARACYAIELAEAAEDGLRRVWLCATPVWRVGPYEALAFVGHSSLDRVRLADLLASARRIAERFPEVRVAAVHRVGDLVVGDLALACAVASAHRAAAFEACAALVDDIKATVPIWKEQSFVDGSSEWVASLG